MEFSGDYNPKEFCWRDLELLTDFFSEEKFIGKINFGKVYRGKTQQGQQVTVKIWLHQPDERDCYPSDKDYCLTRLVSEGIFLSDPDVVHHPDLVKLMGCCCEVEYGHFGVVYDLRSKDTLLNLIHQDDLTWTQRVKVALDIARLVEHLHHHKPPYVLHFTHPALIMLDQDYNPVLFDFFNLSGGAVGDKQLSSYSDMFTFSQGYHGYIDVNFLMTGEWSIKSDEYSFAILLLGLISKATFISSRPWLFVGRNVYRGFIPSNKSHGLEEMNVVVKRSHGLRKREEYMTEVRWLTELQHLNVVKLIGHCEGPANFYLVYELIEGGTVNDKLLGLVNCANDIYAFGVFILELIRKSAAVIVENGTRTHIADVLWHDLKKERVAYQTFKSGGCSKMDARRQMDFAFECLTITRDEEGNLIHIDAAEVFNVMNSLRVKKANKVKSFLQKFVKTIGGILGIFLLLVLLHLHWACAES